MPSGALRSLCLPVLCPPAASPVNNRPACLLDLCVVIVRQDSGGDSSEEDIIRA